ncbi:sodium-coupled monocarboxylate transporter 1-like [Hippoglossus stenolepis]|uniref:sodium-coupled monocarboxylate transporter 1-like n=1 Tax=Hippoglossus stenolepis TaxID=195615 RepID=UPI00159C7F5E|nr:sodium-coupled monocarboxylate transporter 1-like [Hippoglossus stenolepis]
MSGDSVAAGSLAAADYVVFALLLVVSAAIGIYYAWVGRGQNSRDFLTGGRRMTALPVSMSLTASFMSSSTLLANPVEVYTFGAIFALLSLSYTLSIVVTSEVFLPVFYRLSITSTYEYLELRFNRATRLLGTAVFMVLTILYTGIIIYGPALALSQVTQLDLWGGIISTGVVCTFYCTLGGLKAVVWTDVFQVVIMIAGYLSVIIKCMIIKGGVATIISDSQQGGRINIWDFDLNPLRRHTFWTITFGGGAAWIAVNGINQSQVQRYISCKSITHARVALYINLIGLCFFLTCSVLAGMCLYSFYKNCDPWSAGLVSNPDQLMAYLVVDIFTAFPGLPGLFFAAVYSGSLSTVSSSINALATVTIEDLIKPCTNMSEKHLTWLSKGMSVFYGVLCIAMAGLASLMGRIMQATATITGVLGGPLLGLFILGIFCPFANSKGGLSGLMTGLFVAVGVCIGALIFPSPPYMTRPLPLTTEGCNFTTDDSSNWTSTILPAGPSTVTMAPGNNTDDILSAENWLPPSYLYFSLIGSVTAFTVGMFISLLTGGRKQKVESRLMIMKEDTTLYYIFRFFRDRVTRKTGNLDLTKNGGEKTGNTNPAFNDTEMDLKKSTIIS